MDNTLTMRMDPTATHYKICRTCKESAPIKEMLSTLALMIMEGDNSSPEINRYGMAITRAMCENHQFYENGRIHIPLHIEFVNRDMLINA